jgi:hypothetical protein
MTNMQEIEARLRQIWLPSGADGQSRQDWLRAEAARHTRLAAGARLQLALELLSADGALPEVEVEGLARTLDARMRENVRRRLLDIIARDGARVERVRAATRLARRLRDVRGTSSI